MSSKSKFSDISIEKYSDRSVVVRGDTRKYKEDLKKLGGKYNGRLKGGPGWIFPQKIEKDLVKFVNDGVRLVTEQEVRDGEERSKTWEKKRREGKYSIKEEVKTTISVKPTLSEYSGMVTLLKQTMEKVTRLEHAVLMLLDDEQKEMLNILMKPKAKPKKNEEITVEVTDSDSDSDPPLRRLMRK